MSRRETIQRETTQQETDSGKSRHSTTAKRLRANLRLAIDGMHCANCAANIEKHYRATPGVVDVAVNLANNTGRVVFDPAQASVDDMLAVFDDLSFTAEIIPEDAPLVDERRRAREAARAKRDRKVFGAAAVLTVIIVAIGMIPGWHMGVGSGPGRPVRDRPHPCAGHVRGEPAACWHLRRQCSSAAARGSTRARGARSKAARRTWTCSWRSAPPSRFCSRCGSRSCR